MAYVLKCSVTHLWFYICASLRVLFALYWVLMKELLRRELWPLSSRRVLFSTECNHFPLDAISLPLFEVLWEVDLWSFLIFMLIMFIFLNSTWKRWISSLIDARISMLHDELAVVVFSLWLLACLCKSSIDYWCRIFFPQINQSLSEIHYLRISIHSAHFLLVWFDMYVQVSDIWVLQCCVCQLVFRPRLPRYRTLIKTLSLANTLSKSFFVTIANSIG